MNKKLKLSRITLMQYYQDYGHTKPADNEPFRIYDHVNYLETIITDKQGTVYTNHRVRGTYQLFRVANVARTQLVLFSVDEKETVKQFALPAKQMDFFDQADKGKMGYFWFRLYNPILSEAKDDNKQWLLEGKNYNSLFDNHAYTATVSGKTYSGKLDPEGMAYIPQQTMQDASLTIELPDCDLKYSIQFSSEYSDKFVTTILQNGEHATDASYRLHREKMKALFRNQFTPFLDVGWGAGLTPDEREKKRKDEEEKSRLQILRTQNYYDSCVRLWKKHPTTNKDYALNEGDKFRIHPFYPIQEELTEVFEETITAGSISNVYSTIEKIQERKVASANGEINAYILCVDFSDSPASFDEFFKGTAQICRLNQDVEHFKSLHYFLVCYVFVVPLEKISAK